MSTAAWVRQLREAAREQPWPSDEGGDEYERE